ncbi:MAG: hypothetical protein ABI624_24750 [Casimicrobiaceae bacterium]
MTNHHELHCQAHVDHDYASVRETLLADKREILREATRRAAAAAVTTELGVMVGVYELIAELELAVESTWPSRSPAGKPALAITLSWRSPRRLEWFPTMSATMTCYALSATETEIDLDGAYDPARSVFGTIDPGTTNRFTHRVVENFVREVAASVQEEVGRRRSMAARATLVAQPVAG